ncbi:MAG: 4Fe-4S dicluster domain-containing protein [bacterium]
MKALMHDMTQCNGCRGCQVSCKQWNGNPAGKSTFFAGPGYQNPADLNANTYTLITYNEVKRGDRFDWVFGKLSCKHCVEPACVQICPVEAITKTDKGAVIIDRETCIGCQQCATVCPFDTPRYDQAGDGKMHKCWMCFDRLEAGDVTACAKTCAPKAIILGERDDVLKEAKQRITAHPDLYINHIYGQEEAGGTCVFYISNVPFDDLGFPQSVPKHPITVARAEIVPSIIDINPAVLVASVAVAGVGWVIRRRTEIQEACRK